ARCTKIRVQPHGDVRRRSRANAGFLHTRARFYRHRRGRHGDPAWQAAIRVPLARSARAPPDRDGQRQAARARLQLDQPDLLPHGRIQGLTRDVPPPGGRGSRGAPSGVARQRALGLLPRSRGEPHRALRRHALVRAAAAARADGHAALGRRALVLGRARGSRASGLQAGRGMARGARAPHGRAIAASVDRRGEWFVPAFGPERFRLAVGLLFLPYTAMVLGFTVIGSMLAPAILWDRVAAIVLIYFLALGIGAHALDALGSRTAKPWGDAFSRAQLWTVAIVAVVAAYAIGIWYMVRYTPLLWLIAIPEGFFLLAYNLEWFGGRFHRDSWFALSWGALPVLAGYI